MVVQAPGKIHQARDANDTNQSVPHRPSCSTVPSRTKDARGGVPYLTLPHFHFLFLGAGSVTQPNQISQRPHRYNGCKSVTNHQGHLRMAAIHASQVAPFLSAAAGMSSRTILDSDSSVRSIFLRPSSSASSSAPAHGRSLRRRRSFWIARRSRCSTVGLFHTAWILSHHVRVAPCRRGGVQHLRAVMSLHALLWTTGAGQMLALFCTEWWGWFVT